MSSRTAALGGEIEVATLTEKGGASTSPKARRAARPSVCVARASRACARTIRATCTATSASRRRCGLTDKQKKLLRDFEAALKEGGAKHSPQTKGFVDRMKGFFTAE